MSNSRCQNEVNMANKDFNVQQPLLESSSGMDKLRCITNTAHSPVTKITYLDGDKLSFSRNSSDEEFQLTEPWSAKILDKEVEELQQCSTLVP